MLSFLVNALQHGTPKGATQHAMGQALKFEDVGFRVSGFNVSELKAVARNFTLYSKAHVSYRKLFSQSSWTWVPMRYGCQLRVLYPNPIT